MLDITQEQVLAVKRHAMSFVGRHRLEDISEFRAHRLDWSELGKIARDARATSSEIITSIDSATPEDLMKSRERAVDGLGRIADECENERDQRTQIGNREPRDSGVSVRAPMNDSGPVPGVDGEFGGGRHERAFCDWLRAPKMDYARRRLSPLDTELRTASGLTGAAGGFVVPTAIEQPILLRARDTNPFRTLVRVVDVRTSDVSFPLSEGDADSGWVGETDARSATAEPTLASKVPTFGSAYAYIKASEELISDGLIDIGAWFQEEVARAIGEAEMTAIISGNGTDKPTGLLNTAPESGADGSRTANAFKYLEAAATNAVTGDELIDIYYDLKASYRANGRWVMNSATAGHVRKLKDGEGQYLWQTSMQSGQPPTLLGYPVIIAEGMPDLGADEHPIAFGDWQRAYILAKRGGMMVTVDDNITTPGLVKYYIRERLGGCVYDENAVRFLKCASS